MKTTSQLKERYEKSVIPAMMKEFKYKNTMEVPHLLKVVVNCGYGKMVSGKTKEEQKKIREAIARDLTVITGQKPVITLSKHSISTFKIREGQEIGCKVTLRKRRMFDFLERTIDLTLPRSRDFQGIEPKGADQFGNLTFGIREHISFPEIAPEKTNFIFGFEMTVVTTAKTRKEGLELFKLMGFPIKPE